MTKKGWEPLTFTVLYLPLHLRFIQPCAPDCIYQCVCVRLGPHLFAAYLMSTSSTRGLLVWGKTRHGVRTSHRTWKKSLQKTWRHQRCLSQLLPTLLPSPAACAHSDCCAPIPPPISTRHSLWHHSAVKFPVIQSVHVAEPYSDWGRKKDRQKESERES